MYIKQDLWDQLGFQKIDIFIEKDYSKPFVKIVAISTFICDHLN